MVSNNVEQLKKFVIRLFEIGALKFGDFEMKIGLRSPVYFDLRVIISFPDVMVNRKIKISIDKHKINQFYLIV